MLDALALACLQPVGEVEDTRELVRVSVVHAQEVPPLELCGDHARILGGRDDGLLDSLPAGSMRPKVEAAFRFVTETAGEALITSSDALAAGEPGTRVVAPA